MAGTLTFPIDDTLKSIVEHAAAATTRRPTYEQLFEDDNLKPEARGKEAFSRTEDDIDQAKLKPALLLVKDRGAYLMSNGRPNQMREDGKGCVAAYAKGHNPDSGDYDYDRTYSVCGGDDFVQDLDLDFFQRAVANGCSTIAIKLTATRISMGALMPQTQEAHAGDFHGTANDAIEFITSGAIDCGPGEEVEFLRSWQQGALDEWPEFYEWLRGSAH